MPTSEPSTVNARRTDNGGAASGSGSAPPDSGARCREILRADPYYPHTAWRAVVAWLAYFFIFLGFAALIVLMVPHREFGWYYVVTTAMFATVSIAMQFLCRRARVQMLENSGQISPESTTREDKPRG